MPVVANVEDDLLLVAVVVGSFLAYKAYTGVSSVAKTVYQSIVSTPMHNNDGTVNIGNTVAAVAGMPLSNMGTNPNMPTLSDDQFLAGYCAQLTGQPLVYTVVTDEFGNTLAVNSNISDIDAKGTISSIANALGVPIATTWYYAVDVAATAANIIKAYAPVP